MAPAWSTQHIHRMDQRIFQAYPLPVVIIDGAGGIVDSNEAAQALFLDAQALAARDRVRARDAEGRLRCFEPTRLRLSEARVALILVDRTREQDLEGELAVARRSDSLGFASASMVHDLANLLTPIATLSSELSGDLPEAERTSLARQLEASAQVAMGLVRGVQDYVRGRSTSEDSVVAASGMLKGMLPFLQTIAGPKLTVRLQVQDPAAQVKVDRHQLERVLLNLVVNARQHTPEGGTVTLSTGLEELSAAEARERGCPGPGAYVTFRVADTGDGMPEEDCQRLNRERLQGGFFTRRKEQGGTGLGMLCVTRFVSVSRAGLQIRSAPGQGTAVTLYLPLQGRPTTGARAGEKGAASHEEPEEKAPRASPGVNLRSPAGSPGVLRDSWAFLRPLR